MKKNENEKAANEIQSGKASIQLKLLIIGIVVGLVVVILEFMGFFR